MQRTPLSETVGFCEWFHQNVKLNYDLADMLAYDLAFGSDLSMFVLA